MVEGEVEAFQRRAEAFRRAMQEELARTHARQLDAVRLRFQRQIDAEREAERVARRRAIELFERFVATHPSSDVHTPDVLLRLAELYFDDAQWARLEEDERNDRERAARERDGRPTDDIPPSRPADHRCSAIVYRYVIAHFGAYPRRDTAHYLLAWVLRELGHDAEAYAAGLSLVCPSRARYEPRADLALSVAAGGPAAMRCESLLRAVPAIARGVTPRASGSIASSAERAASSPANSTRDARSPLPSEWNACAPLTGSTGTASRHAAEVWYSIGDAHFDMLVPPPGASSAASADPDASGAYAIAAYQRALAASDAAIPSQRGPFYDRSLYKIGWSYFRMNRGHASAIRAFSALMDHYAAVSTPGATNLRADTLRWIGVILSESIWDDPAPPESLACRRIVEDFARPPREVVYPFDCAGLVRIADRAIVAQDRPWLADVYLELAGDYFEQARHYEAIAAYRRFLQAYPDHPRGPFALLRVAEAYRRAGHRAQRHAALEETSRFAGDTPWRRANADDFAALRDADLSIRDALRSAAADEHQRASAARQRALSGVAGPARDRVEREAREGYARAAALYERAVGADPRDAARPRLAYDRADALYWGQRYEEAARAFEAVRDDDDGSSLAASAAYMAVVAREMVAREAIASRAIDPCDAWAVGVASEAEQRACSWPARAREREIPALLRAVLDAKRAYRRAVDEGADTRQGLSMLSFASGPSAVAPPFRRRFEFAVARAALWFGRVREGEEALSALIDSGCADRALYDAASSTLSDSYHRAGRADALAALSARMARQRCDEGSQGPQSWTRATLLARLAESAEREADRASANDAEPRYVRAAELYRESALRFGRDPLAAEALFRAGTMFVRASRGLEASAMFERVLRDFDHFEDRSVAPPRSLPDARTRAEVLGATRLSLAALRRRALDDDAALVLYESVVRDARLAASDGHAQRVRDALEAIATIYGFAQQWERARLAWEQLATAVTSPSERAEALYHAAEARGRAGGSAETVRAMRALLGQVSARDGGEWRLRAQRSIADALEAQGNSSAAERARAEIVAMFRASGGASATREASIAADAQVRSLEERAARIEARPLVRARSEGLTQQLRERAAALAALDEETRAVLALRVAGSSVRALLARGRAQEAFAVQLARAGALLETTAAQARQMEAARRAAARLRALAGQVRARNASLADRLEAEARQVDERIEQARPGMFVAVTERWDREAEASRTLAVQDYLIAAQLARRERDVSSSAQQAIELLRREENRALVDRAIAAMSSEVRAATGVDERSARAMLATQSAGHNAVATTEVATPGLARNDR